MRTPDCMADAPTAGTSALQATARRFAGALVLTFVFFMALDWLAERARFGMFTRFESALRATTGLCCVLMIVYACAMGWRLARLDFEQVVATALEHERKR